MLIIIITYNNLTLIPGLAFLVLFIAYIYDQFRMIKNNNHNEDHEDEALFCKVCGMDLNKS